MLLELDMGANSDVSMKALEDLRSHWERDLESWRGREATYLAPLVQEAVKVLDERSRTTALRSGPEGGTSEASIIGDGDSDVTDSEHDHLEDISTSQPVTGAKRKRGTAVSGRKREKARPAMALELLATRIDLPSSVHRIIRKHPAMKAAVDMEMGLREHQAHDALDDLRTQLITSAGMRQKKQEVSGQNRTTRAAGAIIRKNKAVQAAAASYRRARGALLALGMSTKDEEFRELRKEDVKAFTVLAEEQLLGDSKKSPSWIWENLEFIDARGEGAVKEYFEEGM